MKRILILLIAFSTSFLLQAQYGNIEFVENKGQWDQRVKFKGEIPAGAFFITETGFTVLQHNKEDLSVIYELLHNHPEPGNPKINNTKTLRSHAYNVDFVGASPNFEIVPDKMLDNYHNYFIGDDPSKWAGNVRIFQAVTMKNVYPNVDVRYYTDNGQMKYDIIARPGANIKNIALKYEGVNSLQVKNKQLVIETSVGSMKETVPYSYLSNGMERTEVTAKYDVKEKLVKFDVKNYDPSATLVIDPVLIFASFSGSTVDNWGFTATYGPDGSMYGGGIVFGQGFPTSPGAFQTSYGGGQSPQPVDIGIIRLSPNGQTRLYATYIGGSGNEQPHSLVVDQSGNLILAGRTNSNNYPVTGGGMIGAGGSYDIVVTKLNPSGTAILGSKKIGGSGDDGVNISATRNGAQSLQRNYGDDGRSEVILDDAGNVYVASATRSTNFPATAGSFQPAAGGGNQDGVLLKMDPNVNGLVFASYLGGSDDDAAYVLSLDPVGNIYVAGGTASGDFPGNKSGTLGASKPGGIDGFLAVVSNSGNSIIRSTYLGTNGIDQVYGVQFDNNGFPYIMGQTTGNWPVINAVYSNAGAKQFISKLQPDLSAYVYSTVFGKSASFPSISPVAFLVDRCENVYVSGWGGGFGTPPYNYPNSGTTGLPVTADAIKSTTDGKDFYFFVLQKNAASQLFGSFYGEDNSQQTGGGGADHVDGGTSRFDRNGVIYQAICANCKGFGAVQYPTTPGTWSPNNPSDNCNLAMVKIAFNLAGVAGGVQSAINGVPRDTAGCVPLTVDFTDTVQRAQSYEWNFGDGSPQVTTVQPSTSHTFNAVGNYRVMLVAIDSNTCNIRDTSYISIRVSDNRAVLDFNSVKLNPCDAFLFRFDNQSTAPPAVPFGAQSFIWDFGDGTPRVTAGLNSVQHSYAAPGTYNVTLVLNDSAYCNHPDSLVVQLRVAAEVVADFEVPPTGCVPFAANFINTSIGGQQFRWDFGDGNTSTDINPTNIYSVAGTYTVRLVAIDSATCNIIDSTSQTITVFDLPTANFNWGSNPPVENTPTVFINLSSPDAVRFRWEFGDGDTLETTSRVDVMHQYNATGTYNACLIAYNAAGCPDTLCLPVEALVVPVIDVPNAFTPGKNDVNSIIKVRGFGISKMKFIIYNRWGQKVFESENPNAGWDGTFNGKMQPMDVYAYTLDAEFFDGKRTTKKGDITLIR